MAVGTATAKQVFTYQAAKALSAVGRLGIGGGCVWGLAGFGEELGEVLGDFLRAVFL